MKKVYAAKKDWQYLDAFRSKDDTREILKAVHVSRARRARPLS